MQDPKETTGDTFDRELVALAEIPADVRRLVDGLGTWTPPTAGISLDPVETLGAVAWVVQNSHNSLEAFVLSCEIGGDTDTVAALSGALHAARAASSEHLLSIPWIDDVLWEEIPTAAKAIEALSSWRGLQ